MQLTRIGRPALRSFFRSISSPIINSKRIKPISEMTSMVVVFDPGKTDLRANDDPHDQVTNQQRLPQSLGDEGE